MIRLFVLILLFFAVGMGVFELIRIDSGYVLVSIFGRTIETSFWLMVFTLFVLILLVVLIAWLVKKVVVAILRGGRWYSGMRSQSIERRYREGLLHFLVGEWQQSHRLLSSLSRRRELPVIREIAAAQNEACLNQLDGAIQRLERAESVYKNDALWLQKARLKLLIEGQCFDDAEKLLSTLKENYSNQSLDGYEWQLRIKQQEWQKASALLPQLSKQKGSSKNEKLALARDTQLSALKQLSQSDAASIDAEQLENLWQQVPKAIRSEPEFLEVYAKCLLVAQRHSTLAALIEMTLAKQWLPVLVDYYPKLDDVDAGHQLQQAVRWHKLYGEKPVLLILLGKLAYKNQLWGKARAYFEQHLAYVESRESLYMLGLIAEKIDGEQAAATYFKRAASIEPES